MGKLLEKLLADRISDASERYNLLPSEQMGARPKRSTISAVELLTEQIHKIWGNIRKRVASVLSLDISGTFDNVPHERLVHNMRQKGIPKGITDFINSFLKNRTTSLVLGSFKSDPIKTQTGIPQGSPLSPILFLFFASTLLPTLQTEYSSAVGFVDDTSILTWSNTTEENCLNLEILHGKFQQWAKTHGEKHNLKEPLLIQGHRIEPQSSLRILGIHMDPKLNWSAHTKSVQIKAEAQVHTMSRLTQSTWGATFQKSKLLHSMLVRPALTYGSAIWAEAGPAGKIPERKVKPLRIIQRKCLKKVTGVYNSVSSRVLEHKTVTLPIEIYLRHRRVQHAGLSNKLPVQQTIRLAGLRIERLERRGESLRDKNKSNKAEWARICGQGTNQRKQKEVSKIAAFQEWESSWKQQKEKQQASHRAPADPKTWGQLTCSKKKIR
ncbi:hypothetical protein K3495_g8996 [Podosphaera aphanis]|nr:hypothetical protein K3495_g8996 [Podosphaera aphanis]